MQTNKISVVDESSIETDMTVKEVESTEKHSFSREETNSACAQQESTSTPEVKGRGRRRSRWKLKFHHQALPPEYLDHYEAAMAQQDAKLKGHHSPDLDVARKSVNSGKSDSISGDQKKHNASNKGNSLPAELSRRQPDDMESAVKQVSERVDNVEQTPSPLSATAAMVEQLCLTSAYGGETDSSSRMQNEDSHLPNDRSGNSKGLLGSLLSNDTGIKSLSEVEHQKRMSVIMSCSTSTCSSRSTTPSVSHTPSSSKVITYDDLPYMGEITLDNMKPRRGRKPKKADICHLIYKNYGTVFAGAPNKPLDSEEWCQHKNLDVSSQQTGLGCNKIKVESSSVPSVKCKPFDALKANTQINHSDVQNRIISSLLEKRLTAASQEAKKSIFSSMDLSPTSVVSGSANNCPWKGNNKRFSIPDTGSDEPLNLCVKDLNQLKIRLLRKHGNFYEPHNSDVNVKSEPSSPSDVEELEVNPEIESYAGASPSTSMNNPPIPPIPGGYIYWPNAGVFVHPFALQSQLLYYHKMGAIPLVPISPADPSHTFLPTSIPPVRVPSPTTKPKDVKTLSNKTAVPKHFSSLLEVNARTSAMSTELTFPRMKRIAPLGNPPPVSAPTKRKRSAIFIPPVPSENSSNPTTEVSICKFKFTGGAKPSLQEKKMLSVDSGGNFRYYSGTGDKSMRGYEFFPREALQQSSSVSGTSVSEHFLASSSTSNTEKFPSNKEIIASGPATLTREVRPMLAYAAIKEDSAPTTYDPVPDGSIGRKNELNLSSSGHFSGNDGNCFNSVETEEDHNNQMRLRKKRKTRKSLAREKLEQTFKEKGFLIQTQQLQSAEGATYCKFRQLRKFTRYLFRSWKDYLPGNVREMSIAAGVASPESEQEISSNTPSPSAVPPDESEPTASP